MFKSKWLILLGIFFLVLLLAGFKVYHSIKIWKYSGSDVIFEIRPGEGFASINARLKRQNLISDSKVFHRYSQINGLMRRFQAGRYQIRSQSNMLDILDTFVKGNSITVSVTIPEGKNIYEIAEILERQAVTSKKEFLKMAKSLSFTRSLGIQGNTLEGYLYPETYRFSPQSDAESVIRSMVSIFKRRTKSIDFSRAPLNLTLHQVVILASIVEKETGASQERATIAGVFINRLRNKMRLQSDPTTIYGIFENFTGNLKKKHLLEKTPYNTYKINGLPIGPISNPGAESIRAVLSPEKHDYLYFVSRNDGIHIFSKSYREHLNAVNKYQKDRRMRQGKSWRDLKQ